MATKTIITKNIESLVIHKMANMHREMDKKEFAALKQSISEVGQLVPIILYKDKVVDGRHRIKALKELGINTVKCEILNSRMTLGEVENAVLGTEVRRNDNAMQKSIMALRWMRKNNSKQEIAARKFGIDRTNISRAIKVENAFGADVLDKIKEDGYIILGSKKYGNFLTLLRAVAISNEPTQNIDINLPENVKNFTSIVSDLVLARDHTSLGFLKATIEKAILQLNSK